MITATAVEVRAGAAILIEPVSFRIGSGDKVGLVGRNGAGKTTLTRILAGEGEPASGTVTRTGSIGYLPQDPRTGNLDITSSNRILSARGLDTIVGRLRRHEAAMGSEDPNVRERAMSRYTTTEGEFLAAGGYAAESEAATISASLGLPERVLAQPLHTLSGGQRRRVELARILFSGAGHPPARRAHQPPRRRLDRLAARLPPHLPGGLVVISHDVELLDVVVNRVFHLDANRAELDVYNVGWKAYLAQRETDERRRRRERANAEKKAGALMAQADKMRAKATKAVAAQNMDRRAERLLGGLEAERASDRSLAAAVPEPAPCGKTPLSASGLSKSYGSLEVFTDVDLAIDRGSAGRHPGSQRRRQDDAAADPGRCRGGGHRRGPPGPRPEGWATTPRSTRRSTRREDRPADHAGGRTRAHRHAVPFGCSARSCSPATR